MIFLCISEVSREQLICEAYRSRIKLLVTGFIASTQNDRFALRIECIQRPNRPASVLNPQFFHVVEVGAFNRIGIGPGQHGP